MKPNQRLQIDVTPVEPGKLPNPDDSYCFEATSLEDAAEKILTLGGDRVAPFSRWIRRGLEGASYPGDSVVVLTVSESVFYQSYGGRRMLSRAEFIDAYRPVSKADLDQATFRPAYFSYPDKRAGWFVGLTDGSMNSGFGNPLVDPETARQVCLECGELEWIDDAPALFEGPKAPEVLLNYQGQEVRLFDLGLDLCWVQMDPHELAFPHVQADSDLMLKLVEVTVPEHISGADLVPESDEPDNLPVDFKLRLLGEVIDDASYEYPGYVDIEREGVSFHFGTVGGDFAGDYETGPAEKREGIEGSIPRRSSLSVMKTFVEDKISEVLASRAEEDIAIQEGLSK